MDGEKNNRRGGETGGGRFVEASMGKRILFAILAGVFLGLSAFTFHYAEGLSYLSNDPRACVNCHVMNEQYDGWLKSSHRAVAGCNECHTPHDVVGKYYTKARNGFWHSFYFTFGWHDPIRITPANRISTSLGPITCSPATRSGSPPMSLDALTQ